MFVCRRMRRSICWLLVGGGVLFGQGLNVDEVLRKAAVAGEANDVKTRQYLYREHTVQVELNEKGEESERHTETWEAIALEGSEYRKLIQRDDRALSAKEQKQEDERLRKEAERRRKPKGGGIKNPIARTYTFSFSKNDNRYFDFRYIGEEVFNGRAAYVLEGTPTLGLKPANDREKQIAVSRVKRWIDKEDFIEVSSQVDIVGIGGDARPGSKVSSKQQRMEDGTWLLSEMRILFIFQPRRVATRRLDMVITRSDYRKFAADSRIIEIQ